MYKWKDDMKHPGYEPELICAQDKCGSHHKWPMNCYQHLRPLGHHINVRWSEPLGIHSSLSSLGPHWLMHKYIVIINFKKQDPIINLFTLNRTYKCDKNFKCLNSERQSACTTIHNILPSRYKSQPFMIYPLWT